jgi:hypothetical protein
MEHPNNQNAGVIDDIDDHMRLKGMHSHRWDQFRSLTRDARVVRQQIEYGDQILMIAFGLNGPKFRRAPHVDIKDVPRGFSRRSIAYRPGRF